MRIVAQRYDTQEVVEVTIADGRVARVVPVRPASNSGPTGNLAANGQRLAIVAPGFVDIQVNGYLGQEFSSLELTPERVAKVVREHFAFGCTAICPTLTTQSREMLSHGMRQIDTAANQCPEMARAIAGIHLEGPYFATEDGPRGAHPVEHCREPNWDEFQALQEAAGGRICILTMSPHFDNAPEFIAKVSASGVVVSIGHTGASGEQIRAAVDSGARLSTHLGNGAHRMLRRHPNYLWDQLAEDRLQASLIVDGHHLPPEVVRVMVRAKTPRRCILVSDVSGLGGLPVGIYQSSGCQLEVLPDGRLVIAGQDQLLAGANLPIGVGVANVMRFAGVDLATAVEMASTWPSELIDYVPGGLRPGNPADLVLFDLDPSPTSTAAPRILTTILGGQTVHGTLPGA